MRLNGIIVDALVGNFLDSVELQVLDMDTPMGRKKKTHTVKIYDGVPGLAEMRELITEKKKQFGQNFDPRQDAEVQQAASSIALPQALSQVVLDVYDISGKGKYINLVAQLV